RHARAPSRCATMLDVQHLKWLLHWLGHWKSRRIPAGKRFAFTAMQKFKRYLQIVRDAPCFFALLIFEQRPVIDRLRYYAVRAAHSQTEPVRLRCDRRRIEPTAHKHYVRFIREAVLHCVVQDFAVLLDVVLFALE